MKASLDANGKLTILPENDTEEYALKKWWDDYANSEDGGNATLNILFREEEQ